jgi:hypothetical protein
MAQPTGQRGDLPPHQLYKSHPPQAGQSGKGQQQPGATAQGVRFGGAADAFCSGLAKVVPVSIFEKITEVFLAGFLAQDVIAMWFPRVGTSLKTGREKYDPTNDPQMRNRPFHEQAYKWATENWKGLNWVNFNEETKREFATGPGLLALPAFIFLGNRYLGNSARELSYPSLKGLGQGFSEHLHDFINPKEGLPKAPLTKEEYWGRVVPDYIERLFVDPELKTAHGADIRQWSRDWAKELEAQADTGWLERLKGSTKRFFGKSDSTDIEKLAQVLNEGVRTFNRSGDARMLAYPATEEAFKQAVIRDVAPLHHAEHTWISYRPQAFQTAMAELSKAPASEALQTEARGLCQQTSISHLTGDLNRFGGLVKAVWQSYEKNEGKKAISEVAEHTLKSLAGSKLFLGLGTTALTGAYLMKLAFWAQNHKSYQAVRLLRYDGPHKGHQAHQMPQNQQRGDDLRLQAGLPFGAQPALLSSGLTPGGVRSYPSPTNPFASQYSKVPAGFQGRPSVQVPVDWRRA